LSSQIGDGPVGGKPRSVKTMRMYLMTLPAAFPAISSASETFWAVIGWVLERQAMAPPAIVVAYPLVDAILMGMLPRLASTYVPGSVYEAGQGTDGRLSSGISRVMSIIGNVEMQEGRQ
jgi:hypothetical protein